ncbi:Facilitated trehalose transporter Tret1 [Armadillidium vulgare]|nr:Facilitated trehalose transporter Tret1 [Armadillidium vulgare]
MICSGRFVRGSAGRAHRRNEPRNYNFGFSSPAGVILTSNSTDTGLHLTEFENGWFSSISNLGSLAGCPLAGFCINYFGRRGTIIYGVIPVLIGWIFNPAAQNFAMLLVGRIITGVYCSLVSLTVPTYIAEFSSPQIRGTLGGGFQLLAFIGVLYVYCMGVPFANFRWIAIVCAVIPCICSFLMIFCKESPYYLLSKGKDKEAEEALRFFRGKDYDGIESELHTIRESLEESRKKKATFSDLMKPHILKPFLMSLGLMFFQQFSGINAVLFNLALIFETETLFENTLYKAQQKMVKLSALGVYFYYLKFDAEVAASIGWLPLLSLVLYVIAFSLGYGPIPWLMMGELFSPDVKELAASIALLANWIFAFVTTLITAIKHTF